MKYLTEIYGRVVYHFFQHISLQQRSQSDIKTLMDNARNLSEIQSDPFGSFRYFASSQSICDALLYFFAFTKIFGRVYRQLLLLFIHIRII